ncbi:MAG TPA: DNA cytosine methyltransferase [Methylophilaceae bacterium]|nr:DNA cytosine methyltransferase [Methylophilaceae bacterium]
MKSTINHLTQQNLDVHHELIVDLFAGGGGMSEGILMASGRHPDIAINHSDDALSMHRANHPDTRHFVADVFEVCPRTVTQGRAVGHLHLSPDCTHHSQAAGGQPRNEKIRALSWIGKRWAGQAQPRVITLENVHQVEKWGSLVAKRDKATGRVITLHMIEGPDGKKVNRVADPGERVPREFQYLVPNPKTKGRTWKAFTDQLRDMGYDVQWDHMVAADYGAGTTRDRLFMVARNDGKPIAFPAPTHFKKPKKGQLKWHGAHEYIDFSIESRSIFDRKKDLAKATMRRVAKGIKRFVLDSTDPFIVPITNNSSSGVHGIQEPLRTITTSKGGEFALVTPVLTKMRGDSTGQPLTDPLPTITSGGDAKRAAGSPHAMALASAVLMRTDMHKSNSECTFSPDDPLRTTTSTGGHALASAVMIQAGHGDGTADGVKRWGSGAKDAHEPLGTITASNGQALAIASMIQMGYGEAPGQEPRVLDIDQPIGTVTAGGKKHGLVTAHLAQMNGGFYDGDGKAATDPLSTITNSGSQQQLVTAHLCTLRNNMTGSSADAPIDTITASGGHHALVECTLSPDDEARALRVSAFIMSYYGTDNMSSMQEPLPTITTKDRLALVTVIYQGTPYVIVDIKLRMLAPKELYAAQGFRPDYIITHGHDGRKFSGSKQVKMCGNSVSPYPAAALYAACHEGEDMRLVA